MFSSHCASFVQGPRNRLHEATLEAAMFDHGLGKRYIAGRPAEVGGRYWRSVAPSGDRTGGARLLITKCRCCVDFGVTLCSVRTRGSDSKGMARDSSGAAVVVGTG